MNLVRSQILKAAAVAAALTAFTAGAAFAGDVFTARLQGAAADNQIVARSTVWTCADDTCRARANYAPSVSACRSFVREAGPVVSFGTAEAQLTEEQLTACNAASHQVRNANQNEQAAN